MICDSCQAAFFSSKSWEQLRKGIKYDLLTSAKPFRFCTICSTVLQHVKEALATYWLRLDTRGVSEVLHSTVTSTQASTTVDRKIASVREWPELPIKVEKRIGRLSFIVGPLHDAVFVIEDGSKVRLDLDARLFVLSPRRDDELQDRTQLGTSTSSAASLQQVKKWLHDCDSGVEHPECTYTAKCQARRWTDKEDKQFTPTRLLEIGPVHDEIVRVVECEQRGVQGPYTTLSHKWGTIKDRFQLSNETRNELFTGFSLTQLPKTFQEAIGITRKLGIHYVWTDSLCINQGDRADWLHEGAQMEEIYRNSYCNLAAVASADTNCGLFRDGREPDKLPPDIVEYCGSKYALLRPDFWSHQLLNEPLYTRGWVLQERMLAPRILHFAAEQIFWQCPSLIACESSPSGLPYGIHGVEAKLELKWRRALHQEAGLDALNLADLNNIWRNMVLRYTSCNLTKSDDKFVAFIGVTTAMARRLEEKPLAGLWDAVDVEERQRADLPTQLGWLVKDGWAPDFYSPHGKPSQRYEEYRAPTWSWACLDGTVVLRPRIEQPHKVYEAEITDAYVHLQDKDIPAGPLRSESTRLEVTGRMIRSMVLNQTGSVWNVWQADVGHAYLDDHHDVEHLLLHGGSQQQYDTLVTHALLLSCYASEDPDRKAGGQETYSGHALLVKKTPSHEKEYSRLGVFNFEALSQGTWKDLEQESERVDIILI